MNELLTNLPIIIFLVILVNYMVGAFFIVYHLVNFGLDSKTKTLTAVFLAGLAVLLFLNFYFFFKVEWSKLLLEYLNV